MRHLLCELGHPGILYRMVSDCPIINLTALHKVLDRVFMGHLALILCFQLERRDKEEQNGD